MNKKIAADLALIFVTLTWGISFLLTQNTIAHVSVFNFLAARFTVAFLLSSMVFYKKMIKIDWMTFKYGFLVGTILFAGFAVQTIGLLTTTTSKSAFITGINVVLVPIISALLFKDLIKNEVKFGVFLAFIGLGFLTLNGIDGFNIGDLLTFIGAFAFAMHIITVGYYTKKTESIQFAVIQIGAVAFFSWIASFLLETPTIAFSTDGWLSIIFLGVFCTSAAFIVQSIAQQYTTSTHTALIYANEPVFASVFGYYLAGEILGPRGIFGAILILSGMLISEIDLRKVLKLVKVRR